MPDRDLLHEVRELSVLLEGCLELLVVGHVWEGDRYGVLLVDGVADGRVVVHGVVTHPGRIETVFGTYTKYSDIREGNEGADAQHGESYGQDIFKVAKLLENP